MTADRTYRYTRKDFTVGDGGEPAPDEVMRIVKVQRPIYPPCAACLIYNEKRELLIHRFVPSRVLDAMGEDLVAWFNAEWRDGSDAVTLFERVPDQAW